MKYSVWVVWYGALAAMFFGSGALATVGTWVFWLTVAAHGAEFVMKRGLFTRIGGDMSHHFIQTMLYGLFYWRPLERAEEERG